MKIAMIAVSRRWVKLRPAQARSSAGQFPVSEDRDQVLRDVWRLEPGHGVVLFFPGGEPFEELLQGAVLVAGVGAAVAVQQPGHPLLDVAACPPAPSAVRPAGRRLAAASHCTASV